MFASSDLLLLNFGNTVVLFNLRDKKVEHIRLASNSLNLVSNDFVESLVLPVSESQMESIGLIQT
ncbi:hypothetical protein Fmac_001002 [Flemingia macrophylla]|uniref:Uncharacterized protein n=1 Tax=Flemingia macrophylla TaxID=520843 RepID=A0ABD1NFV0_9FABA